MTLFDPEPEPPPPPPDLRSPAGHPIRVGTSGYSFRDWIGPFYPRNMRPSEFLSFYALHFDCVEVNATYYAIPTPETMERMERKTPPGFRFVVKLHQSMTHDRNLDPATMLDFLRVLEPLKRASKYDGLLAQFPWAFRRSGAALAHLDALRHALPAEPLFVEFRHDSWMAPEVEPWLRERHLGFCAVDEPRLPGLMPPETRLTTADGYVRFHGRNAANWWKRDDEPIATGVPREPRRQLRYDYSYGPEELTEWMTKIRELADQARRTYLFFNNCHAGQAARSAKLMQDLLRRQQEIPGAR